MECRNLIKMILESEDFPSESAHEINIKEWICPTTDRFKRFSNKDADADINEFYHDYKGRISAPLLDIGCSGGHNLEFFFNEGFRQLYGLDVSQAILDIAKRRIPEADFKQSEMIKLPYEDEYFGAIISRATYHLTTTQGFVHCLLEAHRVLKQNGILYMTLRPHPDDNERGRIKRISLFTYSVYTYPLIDCPLQEEGIIRNFIPTPEAISIIGEAGFELLSEPKPIITKESSNRVTFAYICQKQQLSQLKHR